jgi:hypothetical protein
VQANATIRKLDTELMKVLGLSGVTVKDIRSEVARLTNSRKLLAAQRRTIKMASAELDVQEVAESIYEKLRPWLSGRRFPEDFQVGGDLIHLTLPNVALNVETFVMLGQCQLTILQADASSRKVLYSASYDASVAEMILRALQFGRRDFHVVATHERAMAALDRFEDFLDELQARVDAAILDTGVGPRWEGEMKRRVLEQAHLDLRELRRPFDLQSNWPIAPA